MYAGLLKQGGAEVINWAEKQITFTHLICHNQKSGLLRTYRQLKDSKPVVVGGGWVMKCWAKHECIQ